MAVVTIQPFREEVSRIIAIYVADGAPRQLNLSAKERALLLHALANTTHPSAFLGVVHTIEWSLRHQAHPNFIRWSICNGNRPRVIFARGLGVAGIMGGLVAAMLITLSNAGRAWRVLSAIGFMIGVATLIAAWKGMCVVCIYEFCRSYILSNTTRSSTACIIGIFVRGSCSQKTMILPRTSNSANVPSILSAAAPAMRTSLGSPSTRNATSCVKSLIVRSGSKSRLCDRFRTLFSSRLSLVRL